MNDLSDFDEVARKAEERYKSFGSVPCPYLNQEVAFNAMGWEHLHFKKRRVARLPQDQYARLRFLHFAPRILRASHTLQGILQVKRWIRIKKHGQAQKLLVEVIYYEFIAVMDHVRIKVVVKSDQGGQPYFHSIIPYWTKDKESGRRWMYSGNPEED